MRGMIWFDEFNCWSVWPVASILTMILKLSKSNTFINPIQIQNKFVIQSACVYVQNNKDTLEAKEKV